MLHVNVERNWTLKQEEGTPFYWREFYLWLRREIITFLLLIYLSAVCLLFIYAHTRLPMYLPQMFSINRFWYNISSLALFLILPDAVKLLRVPFFLTILSLLLRVQTYLSPKFDTHFMNSAVFYYGKSYSYFSAYSWIFSTIKYFPCHCSMALPRVADRRVSHIYRCGA